MKELEVKILEINVNKVRKRLRQLGAKKVYDGPVYTVYLDYKDGRLGEHDESLRVRRMGDTVKVCYKGPNEDKQVKAREEIEVEASDLEDTIKIFERLGLQVQKERTKHRESYKIGRVVFEIDKYRGIPTFLEIEAPTKKEIKHWARQLGYTMKDATNMSIRELEKYYNKH